MSKHTPAPWTNLPRMQCIPICGQDEAGLSLGFINSSNSERTAEGKANAKLIAAAPDLLEAAEMAIAWYARHEFDTTGERGEYNFFDEDPEFVTCARAAIAKAKGEFQ